MKKCIHLCAGDIYINSKDKNEVWENCDVTGYVLMEDGNKAFMQYYDPSGYKCGGDLLMLMGSNPNKTTLDKYFIRPFEQDSKKRPAKVIIIDTKMDILEKWPWKTSTVLEIVMVNSFEHFTHNEQIPHIINEAQRVLKSGGIFKFDFPDILEIVRKYRDSDHNFLMELVYGSRKNDYSRHEWGYTKKTIVNFFNSKYWEIKFRNVVTHDYPATGVFAIKK